MTRRETAWLVGRILFIVWFAWGGTQVANFQFPELPWLTVGALGALQWFAVVALLYSQFRAALRRNKPGTDWRASLWTSSITANPLNFSFVGAIAFIALALVGAVTVASRGGSFLIPLLSLFFGTSTLTAVLLFRWRNAQRFPNQTPSTR